MTPDQTNVRDFILEFQAKHGRRPSHKEIMIAANIGSFWSVSRIVRRLERARELVLVYIKPRRS